MNHTERFPPKIHNFKERLEFSEKKGHEDFWQAIYKKGFPDLIFAELVTGKCQGQYLGIDRVIYLKSGKTLYIDEKKREKDWEDILLEYISVDKLQTPGWMECDLLIDFLAYAFIPSKRCYLFPWQLLKRTWLNFKNEWIEKGEKKIDGFRKVEAENEGYKTISVVIPTPIILKEIKNSLIIQL